MKASRWVGEDAETTWKARSINTSHANVAPHPLLQGVSQTFGPHCIQKALDAASTSWKCSCTERLSVASQADGMAFYRWKVGLSWWCIYRYFKWIGFYFLLPPRQDGCLLRCFFLCLKKASLLLQFILFPEGQAVKLLQGHAKHLLEVLRR